MWCWSNPAVAGVGRRWEVQLPTGRRRCEVRELSASAAPTARPSRSVFGKLNRRNLRVLKEKRKNDILNLFVLTDIL